MNIIRAISLGSVWRCSLVGVILGLIVLFEWIIYCVKTCLHDLQEIILYYGFHILIEQL